MKFTKIEWAIILACFLAVMYQPTYALDVEIGTGTTHFKHQHDGVWYQEAYAHEFDLNSVPMSLGVAFEYKDNLYRMEFLSLGAMFSKALATSDTMYYPGSPVKPHAVFDGRGSVSGVVLSAVRPVRVMGLPLYAEAGVFIFRHKWNMTINGVNGEHYAELQREPEINYGPVLGFGIRGKGVDIGVRYLYLDAAGGEGTSATPPLATHAYTLMFKAYF